MTNSKMTKEQLREKRLADMAERRALVEDCCTVRGPHPLLGLFEEDIFKYDNWNVEEALNYLAGVKAITFTKNIPDVVEIWTLSLENYSAVEDSDIIKRFENEIGRLWEIWNSGHHYNPNPPKYYIDWALSKNIKIHWLEYAIEKGLLGSLELNVKKHLNTVAIDKPLNTRTENNYLRLIMTLANGIKGFDPKKPYEAAQLIIDETGTSLGRETIAGYITKAYELETKNRD